MAWKKLIFSDDATAVSVSKNSGAVIGTRSELNFVEGTNIGLSIADDDENNEVDITISNTIAADIDMNSKKIINLTTPEVGTDGANKSYVDINIAAINSTIANISNNLFNISSTYFRYDGLIPMSGELNLNEQNITNVSYISVNVLKEASNDVGLLVDGILIKDNFICPNSNSSIAYYMGGSNSTLDSSIRIFGKDYFAAAYKGAIRMYVGNANGNGLKMALSMYKSDSPEVIATYGFKSDYMYESSTNAGVTIDSCTIKDGFVIFNETSPSSSISSGWLKGQIAYDNNYLFVAVGNASIKRVALTAY